jgi:hypothetical protein
MPTAFRQGMDEAMGEQALNATTRLWTLVRLPLLP